MQGMAQIVPMEESIDFFDDGQVAYDLPTGDELMNRPILEGGPTRGDQEIHFVMGR